MFSALVSFFKARLSLAAKEHGKKYAKNMYVIGVFLCVLQLQ
jgi:hypothetical protein